MKYTSTDGHPQSLEDPLVRQAFRTATVDNAQAGHKERESRVSTSFNNRTMRRASFSPRRIAPLAAHKETTHYHTTWRDTVAGIMAEPRQSVNFANIDPPDMQC
jgi:autoinducer 2-degrading protein